MDDSFLRKSDELSRRRFMGYASKSLLGVSVIPTMLPLAGRAAGKPEGIQVSPSQTSGRKPTRARRADWSDWA